MVRIPRGLPFVGLLFLVAASSVSAAPPRRVPVPLRASASSPGGEAHRAATSVPDGAGGLYFGWSDRRDGHDDVYVLRLTSAGQPAAGWPATGVLVSGATGHQRLEAVVSDGANGVILAWRDERSSEGSGDLWAQRVNSAGVPQWTTDGVLVAREAFRSFTALVSGDGAGGLVCTWRRDGADTDVMAARVQGSGTTPAGWSVDGVAVCTLPQHQEPGGIVGDGTGGAYVVWTDQRTGGEGVYAQHLSAAGVPLWAADGQRLDTGSGGGYPLVCGDGAGGMITAWMDFDVLFGQRLNAAGAAQWSAGGVRVSDTATPFGFSIDPAPGGGAFVAWARDVGGETEVRAQSVTGAGARAWDTTGVVVAHTGPGYAYAFRTVPDGSGGAILAWFDGRSAPANGSAIWAQRLNALGTALWSADGVPVAVSPTLPDAPEMIGVGAGGALLAWHDYSTSGEVIRVQRFDGAGVPQFPANGQLLLSDEGSQRAGLVVPDGTGGTWVVWEQTVNGQPDLRARRLGSNGQPAGPTVTICDAPGRQYLVQAGSDGAGGVLVAWTDERAGGSGADFYAQRVGAASTVLWSANGVAVSGVGVGAYGGAIVADGSGGAFVVWTVYGFDVRVQHLDAAGSSTWAAGGVAVCPDAELQHSATLVADGAGGVIVAWTDWRVSGDRGVYAQRLGAAGAAQWTADGVRIGSFGDLDVYTPEIVSDGAAGAVVLLYASDRDPNTDTSLDTLRAQRVTSAGVPQWGPRGTVVRATTTPLRDLRGVADGLGGAVVAWSEERGSVANVYAQRVGASGSPQWAAGGLAVCEATGLQELAGLAGDGAGGAFLSWSDERSTPGDLYAQKLAASGAALWGTNGTPVAAGPRGQYGGGIAPDGAGGAFVTWVDHVASGQRHVSAQHLTSGGAGTWGAGGVTSVLASLAVATLDDAGARLEWQLGESMPVTLERATTAGEWAAIAELQPDGQRRVRFDDATLAPDVRRGYRLSHRGGDALAGSEVWLEPSNAIGLSLAPPSPNPVRGRFTLTFTLADARGARLEIFDVAGRALERHALDALGAGRHVLRVGERCVQPGVHFARLTQDGRVAQVRVVKVE